MFPDNYAGGSISVIASNGCGATSRRRVHVNSCINGFTGVNNNNTITKGLNPFTKSAEMNLLVFPNPTTNEFKLNVKTNDEEKIVVKVMDASGRLMKNMGMMPNETIAFGNDFKAGAYFIEVSQGDKTKTQRVIKF